MLLMGSFLVVYIIWPLAGMFLRADRGLVASTSSVELAGKEAWQKMTVKGEPIVYGLVIPRDAPNMEGALSQVGSSLARMAELRSSRRWGRTSSGAEHKAWREGSCRHGSIAGETAEVTQKGPRLRPLLHRKRSWSKGRLSVYPDHHVGCLDNGIDFLARFEAQLLGGIL